MKSANYSYKVSELIRGLEYQHPMGVSTFGTCIKCRANASRGGCVCANCLEDELAEIIGKPLAWEVHQALKTYNLLKIAAIYGKDNDEGQDQEVTP